MPSDDLSHVRESLINYAKRTNKLIDQLNEVTVHSEQKEANYQQEASNTKKQTKALQAEVIQINQDIKEVEMQIKNTISTLKHLARGTDMHALKSRMKDLDFEGLATRDYVEKQVLQELNSQ